SGIIEQLGTAILTQPGTPLDIIEQRLRREATEQATPTQMISHGLTIRPFGTAALALARRRHPVNKTKTLGYFHAPGIHPQHQRRVEHHHTAKTFGGL